MTEMSSVRPDRIEVELTECESDDDNKPQQRVDLVRVDTLGTVASLTPYQALTLVGKLISAVQQARENGRAG